VDPSTVEPASPDQTDEELLRLAASGDRAAFGRLVGRHEAALHRFAVRACRGEREAEDALQDGLLATWRGAATYRGDASVRTWLFQLVVNACHRRHRRRSGEPARTEPVEAASTLADGEPAPDERAGFRQVGRALDAALAAMPAEAREVLLLRDVEGLSGEEAARALGITLAALKSRLHRARLELKRRVEGVLGHAVEEVVP
jgi:RNA polymerase sigma-70 factor (ECF subfamily)